MGAKVISISADDTTYYTLPGSTGDMQNQADNLEDTVFGSSYKSIQPGVINWQVTANAFYKGYPGYVCNIKKPSTSTTMTAEACTLVSGKTYQITAAGHRITDRSQSLIVYDNGVDHTADVLSYDYLYGKVTFKSAYTVTGPVTVTGKYIPTVSLGKYTNFTLTQSVSPIKANDLPTLAANGGLAIFQTGGLREVALQLPAIYAATDGWNTNLIARAEYILEINPDGLGSSGSLARGFFKLMEDKRSGAVGALEEEMINFHLVVPLSVSSQLPVASPFAWQHSGSTPIPTAVKILLDAFEQETLVYVKYLGDGTNGYKGQAVVANMSLTGGENSINTFSVTLQGSGALTALP